MKKTQAATTLLSLLGFQSLSDTWKLCLGVELPALPNKSPQVLLDTRLNTALITKEVSFTYEHNSKHRISFQRSHKTRMYYHLDS